MYRVITIQQPFAWGIVNGWKDSENRSWYTNYRGPVWIHAGKSLNSFQGTSPEDWERQGNNWLFPKLPKFNDLKYGHIIGEATIWGCTTADVARVCRKSIHYTGPFCFCLHLARMLKTPIPLMGQLGIYKCDIEPKDEMFHPYSPVRKQNIPMKLRKKS